MLASLLFHFSVFMIYYNDIFKTTFANDYRGKKKKKFLKVQKKKKYSKSKKKLTYKTHHYILTTVKMSACTLKLMQNSLNDLSILCS